MPVAAPTKTPPEGGALVEIPTDVRSGAGAVPLYHFALSRGSPLEGDVIHFLFVARGRTHKL